MTAGTARWRRLLLPLAALLVIAAIGLVDRADRSDERIDGGSAIETTIAAVSDLAPARRFSDLPLIGLDELPPEAIQTLILIDQGGPYPFDRDDLVFQNREARLPDRPQGHYREYTVITPGEDDRGARRVVSGEDGERYYTADHYGSFREIVEGG